MELIKLELKGFRGFKSKQTIKFLPNKEPIVLVGINGAGKTSILDAIKIGIHPFLNSLVDSKSIPISPYNINIDSAAMEIELEWKYPIESDKETYKTTQKLTTYNTSSNLLSREVLNLSSDIRNNISLYKNQYSLGLFIYYPSNRLVSSSSLDIDNQQNVSDGQLSAFINASASSINFKSFFRWFRSIEDIENEQRLTENPAYTEPKLQAVKNAILAFLDDFSELRVQRVPSADMVIKKEGSKLSVNQLSSGEKSILTMIGDLARRLAIANPGLKNPLDGKAVVLIDEVDLHLHPKWQKEIVAKLKTTFPNVQFILTTHSPLIINHLKTESIYLLDNFECIPALQTDLITYSADLSKLLAWQGLENGSIPTIISDTINKIATLINEDKLDEAKLSLDNLKKVIDPNHPEIKDLETELEVKEIDL